MIPLARVYFNILLITKSSCRHVGRPCPHLCKLFDPWENPQPHIPGSLVQPGFNLPFEPGDVWALTGGPHTGWGNGAPLSALDFAPPSRISGCVRSGVWATAMADGVVVRSTIGEVMLDLDGDGDERTGWTIFYMHVASEGRALLGTSLKKGDRIGHPSCEGGTSTGTHIHIARKFNGEWLPAAGIAGVLPFSLEGWIAHKGSHSIGTLTQLRVWSPLVCAPTPPALSRATGWRLLLNLKQTNNRFVFP
jgi:hypothetical protein